MRRPWESAHRLTRARHRPRRHPRRSHIGSAIIPDVVGQPYSLEGRCAVLTGSTSGIGLASARMLAECGADVVLNGRDPVRLAEAVRAVAATAGARVQGVGGDAASGETIEALIAAAASWGGVSIAVANAGGGVAAHEVTELTAAKLWRGNVWSAEALIRAVGPPMIRQGWGRIIKMSSLAARSHSPTSVPAYAAAKAGVQALTRSAAVDLAPHGITVNCIAPGVTATERIIDRLDRMPDEKVREIRSRIPVGRWAEPAEVAAAVTFLCSPAAGYITGHTLDVNGGAWMN